MASMKADTYPLQVLLSHLVPYWSDGVFRGDRCPNFVFTQRGKAACLKKKQSH